ncbi:hypothetical protein Bpfe_005002 [Biomphalaria pfeifferi]|uniref:Uncharacterized protein n=1 Tax=Biomphalaria pfeifferi TaxID=112525 RepID=A0AAD8FJM2_BIOPF|nr:hypothetical protein Bpfe_005002 [Biomphalaria pfeifferi]
MYTVEIYPGIIWRRHIDQFVSTPRQENGTSTRREMIPTASERNEHFPNATAIPNAVILKTVLVTKLQYRTQYETMKNTPNLRLSTHAHLLEWRRITLLHPQLYILNAVTQPHNVVTLPEVAAKFENQTDTMNGTIP